MDEPTAAALADALEAVNAVQAREQRRNRETIADLHYLDELQARRLVEARHAKSTSAIGLSDVIRLHLGQRWPWWSRVRLLWTNPTIRRLLRWRWP